jgi:hypothetical protein
MRILLVHMTVVYCALHMKYESANRKPPLHNIHGNRDRDWSRVRIISRVRISIIPQSTIHSKMLLTGGALRTGVAAQELSRQMTFTFYKTLVQSCADNLSSREFRQQEAGYLTRSLLETPW